MVMLMVGIVFWEANVFIFREWAGLAVLHWSGSPGRWFKQYRTQDILHVAKEAHSTLESTSHNM